MATASAPDVRSRRNDFRRTCADNDGRASAAQSELSSVAIRRHDFAVR